MLEGVLDVGEQFCFVKKFRRLQSCEAGLQIVRRQLRNVLQQREGDIFADDGSSLQQALVLRLQAVDTSRAAWTRPGTWMLASGACSR